MGGTLSHGSEHGHSGFDVKGNSITRIQYSDWPRSKMTVGLPRDVVMVLWGQRSMTDRTVFVMFSRSGILGSGSRSLRDVGARAQP